MAKYRQVHTKIWKDSWFCELPPKHKLFFVYLFTNEMASISGLYELSPRIMSFETGLSQEDVQAAINDFDKAGKVHYGDGVVWVVGLRKYHETTSPKVQTAIQKDIDAVKDCEIKRIYCERYGIDTLSGDENKVAIPRSSSSIGSRDRSSGSSRFIDERLLEILQPLRTALSVVVKETDMPGFDEGKYIDVAEILNGRDATPDDIKAFGKWWTKNGWHDDTPVLKNVVDNWGDFKSGRCLKKKLSVNGNTNNTNPPAIIPQATADELAEFEALIKNSEVK